MPTIAELMVLWATGGKDPVWLSVSKHRASRVIKELSEYDRGVNHRLAREDTPLMIASLHGRPSVVSALIDAGADLNLQNTDGMTALHVAAFFGRVRIVNRLLEAGADPRCVNHEGRSPLDLVSTPWSDEVEAIYRRFDGPLNLGLNYLLLPGRRAAIARRLKSL